MDLGYPVFDADHHLYETPESLLKYLPSEYEGAIQFVQIGKRTRIAILGKITEYMPNPTFSKVAPPGAHELYYAGKNTEGLTLREMSGVPIEPPPDFREPGPRLAKLDQQGVQTAIVYPTLANLVEHSAQEDPDLVHAVIHSLNQWLHEEWTFNYGGNRILTTPVITLALVDEALAELEWVLERGAKVILVRPAPTKGRKGFRSPALEEFDPFWARVEAAGIPVVLHASQPPLDDYVATWENARSNSAFAMSPFKAVTLGHRDITDMIASLICHGTLTRFPGLKIASIENGSHWVRQLLEDLDLTYGKMPQAFKEHPVEVFRRNVWVNPFWETQVEGLADLIGEDRVLFGSDYPHPEGLAEPVHFLKYLGDVSDDLRKKIMCTNAYELVGLPIPA